LACSDDISLLPQKASVKSRIRTKTPEVQRKKIVLGNLSRHFRIIPFFKFDS
jgi:hypothetical protein